MISPTVSVSDRNAFSEGVKAYLSFKKWNLLQLHPQKNLLESKNLAQTEEDFPPLG